MNKAQVLINYDALSDEELALAVQGWDQELDTIKAKLAELSKRYREAHQHTKRLRYIVDKRTGATKSEPA